MIEYIEEIINEAWIESNESFDKQNTLNKINALFNKKEQIKNLKDLLNFVLNKYKITLCEIKGKSRKEKFVKPRQIYCYMAKQLFIKPIQNYNQNYSNKQIGFLIYRTTYMVLYGAKTIRNQMEVNRALRNEVNNLINQIIIIK